MRRTVTEVPGLAEDTGPLRLGHPREHDAIVGDLDLHPTLIAWRIRLAGIMIKAIIAHPNRLPEG